MDALFTTFLAAAFAEIGDKTQLLVIALAARFGRPAPVLAGVAVAALLNCLIAAVGGALIQDFINLRAISLLLAVALAFTGLSGLIVARHPRIADRGWKQGAFSTTLGCFLVIEFGDKTQFLTAAFAARYDAWALAAIGAALGVLAANTPGAFLGDKLEEVVPLRTVRTAISVLFLLAGAIVAVNALRLI